MDDEKTSSKLWSFNSLIYFIIILIIGNLFIIDVALFGKQNITQEKSETQTLGLTPTPLPNISEDIQISPTKIPVTPAQKTAYTATPITAPSEFFIPLGTGSSTSTSWEDVPGAQAYVDSTLYKSIDKVTFEASLYTPTGDQSIQARLYNVTDDHPVWFSEVSVDGGLPQLKISGNITLDNGSKLYQVQIKTQLGSRASLENARIHILTK